MAERTTIDSMFRALSHAYRRHTLDCLQEHGSVTLADLANEVAASVFEQSIDDLRDEAVVGVYHTLYHTHIPILEEARMAEFDESRSTVSLGETARRAFPYLALAENEATKRV